MKFNGKQFKSAMSDTDICIICEKVVQPRQALQDSATDGIAKPACDTHPTGVSEDQDELLQQHINEALRSCSVH